jgi:hypothetical protein
MPLFNSGGKMMSNMKLRLQFSSLKTLALVSLPVMKSVLHDSGLKLYNWSSSMKLRVFAFPLCLVLLGGLASAQDCGSGGPSVGTASFSRIINWELTGDFSFTIANAPPNVCGNLVTTRNGTNLCAPGWVCTDAMGSAHTNAGGTSSWSWAGQPNDQTDTHLHFNWPDGTTTYSTTNHYWDKTCPTVKIDPLPKPPSSFTGTGMDGMWGAGFSNSWTLIPLKFFSNTTGRYWNPNTNDYTDVNPPPIYGRITSGSGSIGPLTTDFPSYSIHWAADRVPSVDTPGLYTWTVSLGESQSTCIASNPGSTQPIQFRVRIDHSICQLGVDSGCF